MFHPIRRVDAVLFPCSHLPKIYQTFIMSATFNEDVQTLKELVLHNPVRNGGSDIGRDGGDRWFGTCLVYRFSYCRLPALSLVWLRPSCGGIEPGRSHLLCSFGGAIGRISCSSCAGDSQAARSTVAR